MAYKKIDYIQENKRLWFHKGAFLRKIKVNRKHKDRLFRHLFMDKKDLLDLYNSLADKDYTNTDEMTIITLKDAIFMKMKNLSRQKMVIFTERSLLNYLRLSS